MCLFLFMYLGFLPVKDNYVCSTSAGYVISQFLGSFETHPLPCCHPKTTKIHKFSIFLFNFVLGLEKPPLKKQV